LLSLITCVPQRCCDKEPKDKLQEANKNINAKTKIRNSQIEVINHLIINSFIMFGLEKLFGPKADFRSLKENGAIILDVRTPAEYRTGHIPGSMNVSVERVRDAVTELKKRNKPVITCCRSGARSGVAAGVLKSAGIEAYNGGPWNDLLNRIS
jgi:phage shock protein E